MVGQSRSQGLTASDRWPRGQTCLLGAHDTFDILSYRNMSGLTVNDQKCFRRSRSRINLALPAVSTFKPSNQINLVFAQSGGEPPLPIYDAEMHDRQPRRYQIVVYVSAIAAIITNRTAGNRQTSPPDFWLSHRPKARDRISQANRAGSGLAPEPAHCRPPRASH